MNLFIKLLALLAINGMCLAANEAITHCPPVNNENYLTKNNYGRSTYKNYDKEILQFIMAKFGDKLSLPILDVGAGYGGASYDLLQMGAKKIYANDLSEKNLNCMKDSINQSFPHEKDNIHYLPGDITDKKIFSKLPANRFGLVYAKHVIHFFTAEQISRFIVESHNLLINDGILFLAFENPFLSHQLKLVKNIRQDYFSIQQKEDNSWDKIVKNHYQASKFPNGRACSYHAYEQTPKSIRSPGFPCQIDTLYKGELRTYQLILPDTLSSMLELSGFTVVGFKEEFDTVIIIARKETYNSNEDYSAPGRK